MALPSSGDHAPDGARAPAGTEPAYTGAADVFQLRLRGSARGLRARFVRAQPTARAARQTGRRRAERPRVAVEPARDHQPQRVGRRQRAAARGAPVRRGPGRVRAPHGQRQRLRARGVGRDRARDRALPPRLQRLERHRLQLPRRPVRPGLRRPRGRHRPGRDRRPGPGLQLRLDRDRLPRHLQRAAAVGGRPRGARAPDRLEALAARRADRGHGRRDLARRRVEPLSERHRR